MLERRLLSCVACSLLVAVITQNNVNAEAGPSQIDLESTKTDVICATQKKPLSCASPGSTIAVTGAFWGRLSASICPSDDGDSRLDCGPAAETLGIVKGKCEGQDSCEVEARHSLLQNAGSTHCPGVNKYLIVNYTCIPDAKEVTICDSENTTLDCPANWKVNINSAFWGRQSVSVCPAQSGQTMCTGATEALGLLKEKCDGVPNCDIHASSQTVQNGAENCPGVEKYLIVDYSCKPHPNIETSVISTELAQEGESPPQGKADVSQALSDMDSGSEQVGTDISAARLGMGGLKALEKINNLIRASAEEGGPPLSEEQAKNIERMIIAGIKEIKTKESDAKKELQSAEETAERASIPRLRKVVNKSASKMKQLKNKKPVTVPLPAVNKNETIQITEDLPKPKKIHIIKISKPKENTEDLLKPNKVDTVATPIQASPSSNGSKNVAAEVPKTDIAEKRDKTSSKETKEDKHSTKTARVFAPTKAQSAPGISDFGNMP